MKKGWITFSAVTLLTLLSGCGGNEGSDSSDSGAFYENYLAKDEALAEEIEAEYSETNNDQTSGTSDLTIEIPERKLIKTGYVSFEVDEFGGMDTAIDQAVDRYQAYISSENEYQGWDRVTVTVEIRVPAEHFDALLADVTTGVNDFDSREINVSDVTEEYIDVEARIKTKKELEAQYVALLGRAVTVHEVLEIEHELGYVREEIESLQGRLNYLKSSVAFSTLTVSYYKLVDQDSEFGREFKGGFRQGWDNLVWFFVALTHIWPFLLFAMLGIIVWRAKRKNKIKTNK